MTLFYFRQVLLKRNLRSLRNQLINYARQHGIKPTARIFHTTPRTVRKWLRRAELDEGQKLTDRRSLHLPRSGRISASQKNRLRQLKRKHPQWGVRRLRTHYKLGISEKTMRRILKETEK